MIMDIATITQILNQVSKLEIIIGTIIGIITTFIGYSIMEWNKNRNFRNNIKNFIKNDLNDYNSILQEIKQKARTTTSPELIEVLDSELILKIYSRIPDVDSKFRSTNFLNLSLEIRAKVFNPVQADKIEAIYNKIPNIRVSTGLRVLIYTNRIDELIQMLDNVKL